MLGKKIAHPPSTNFYEPSGDKKPAKRPRLAAHAPGDQENEHASSPLHREDTAASEGEGDVYRNIRDDEHPWSSQTELESALPPIETDQDAIEAYDAMKAAEEASKLGLEGRMSERKWVRGKSSIYVDAFNLALDTVLEEESHLFDEAEMTVFRQWRELPYEPQYLYVRLFLRKTSAWHRVNSLGYHGDIADIDHSIETLQEKRDLPPSTVDNTKYPGELAPPEGTTLGDTFTFADNSDEGITTLEEASSLLKLDELKAFAKEAKVTGKNKPELLRALRRSSGRQAGLGFVGLKRSDTDTSSKSAGSDASPDRSGATTPDLEHMSEANRDLHFTRKILNETGSCIRLTLAPLKLFERVHLVFYRSSEWTEKSLTSIILAKIARRNFPAYIVSRSASVFASRGALLEFEAALRLQFRVDCIVDFTGVPTDEGPEVVLDILEDVHPRWRVLLAEEQRKEDSMYHSSEGSYLRRLSPAWVYTRVLHKAAGVLGQFKQHKREHALLAELLAQRLFHASRRGAWYQRRALLEEHYMAALSPNEGRAEEQQRRHWKRVALRTCEDGLRDGLVHVIHHYDLQKRVTKLERALRVARREQHDFAHVRLARPAEVTVEGVRIEREAKSGAGRRNSSPGAANPGRRGQRTIWLDPLGGDAECTVEEMCLSHYRALGWKGYHSEGGLARTLFGYLFCDVLFAYVPNVFQTAFQTCPLDLHTDSFYPSRFSEISHRLAEIGNGGAAAIVRRVWDEYAERRTCIVGLDWTFALDDLLEIVRCFDGEALATMCKVLAQEYGQRGGGMPDLFLWHPEKGEVKFAEVKSENDRLSDTQRLWIHVLTGAGINVDLCHAVAKEVRRMA